MGRQGFSFVIGAASGLALAVALNLLPRLQSRGAEQFDGFVFTGFPFTFHRVGGFAGISEFHLGWLGADLAIALAFAVVVGWGTVKLAQWQGRHRRGFPVVRG